MTPSGKEALDDKLRSELRKNFCDIVRDKFKSGFDPGSFIDRKKFGKAWEILTRSPRDACELSEETLAALANEFCLKADGKFFAPQDNAKEFFEDLFASLKEKGESVIFYENLFNTHILELGALGIASTDALKKYIEDIFDFQGTPDFFAIKKGNVDDEIRERIGDKKYLRQEEQERLFPYMPPIIVQILARAFGFARLKNGDIFLASAADFDPDEWNEGKRRILEDIKNKGYSYLGDLKLEQSRENLSGMSEDVFKYVLDRKLKEASLARRGKIINKESGALTFLQRLENFCATAEKFTLESLELEFGAVIKKERNLLHYLRKYAIQISPNTFINKEKLIFNSTFIDDRLDLFYKDAPGSLISFSDFSLFPDLDDFTWNHFILQSYIMQFSNKFAIIAPATNNCCIGIIYDKNKFKGKDYLYLVKTIAIKDKVNANFEELEPYLKRKGLFCRVRKKFINELITCMKH